MVLLRVARQYTSSLARPQAASSSCLTGVSVKAQYCHLGAQPGTGAGVGYLRVVFSLVSCSF